MQQPRKTIWFDLKIVGGRRGWQNKFPEGASIVDTWVDGVYYRDAQVIEGFIVELADDSFGPTRPPRSKFDNDDDEPAPKLKPVQPVSKQAPLEERFHWNFRITDPEKEPSVSSVLGPAPVLKPVAQAAAAIPKRGAVDGMGLLKGTRIQNSTLDKVTFVDAVVVTDGSIVELAQLTEPERIDARTRPVVVEGCSIDGGNFLKCHRMLRNRRIFNAVVIGTGNRIDGDMVMCNVTGSENWFEGSAESMRVKGSRNLFRNKPARRSAVVGDDNHFRNGVLDAEITGSGNVFAGAVINAKFDGDATQFQGQVSAILK